MTNLSDQEYDIAFAPTGPGIEYLIGISANSDNTVLQKVDGELVGVQSDGLLFAPHQHMTFHAVYLAAALGQAEVQACLPTKIDDVEDPYECKSITVHVH